MKKLLSSILCLVMLMAMVIPVAADDMQVYFTSDSSFVVGGTVTVDRNKTFDSVADNGLSQDYNAFLEGNVVYEWFKNGAYFHTGQSLTITTAEQGYTITCRAFLYETDPDDWFNCLDAEPFQVAYQEEPEEEEYFLEIMREPNKYQYVSGEKLDLTGLWVRIYTPDGFIDSYDGDRLTYTKNALVTVGDQKIKLSYEDAFAIFLVTVLPAPETEPEETDEITEAPEETEDVTENVTEEVEVTEAEPEQTQDVTQGTDGIENPITTGTGDGLKVNSSLTKILILLAFVAVCMLVPVILIVVIIIIIVKKKKSKKAKIEEQ